MMKIFLIQETSHLNTVVSDRLSPETQLWPVTSCQMNKENSKQSYLSKCLTLDDLNWHSDVRCEERRYGQDVLFAFFVVVVYLPIWHFSVFKFLFFWGKRNISVHTWACMDVYTTQRYVSLRTCYNLQVEQTGTFPNSIAGGTLVESWGAGADVSQGDGALHLVWRTHTVSKHTNAKCLTHN